MGLGVMQQDGTNTLEAPSGAGGDDGTNTLAASRGGRRDGTNTLEASPGGGGMGQTPWCNPIIPPRHEV